MVAMGGCGYCTTWADNVNTAMAEIKRYMDGHYVRPNWVRYSAPARS
jgi:hypothetical protein